MGSVIMNERSQELSEESKEVIRMIKKEITEIKEWEDLRGKGNVAFTYESFCELLKKLSINLKEIENMEI